MLEGLFADYLASKINDDDDKGLILISSRHGPPQRRSGTWRTPSSVAYIGSRALSFSGPLLSVSVEFCLFVCVCVCLFVCPQLWGQISRKPKVLGEKLL